MFSKNSYGLVNKLESKFTLTQDKLNRALDNWALAGQFLLMESSLRQNAVKQTDIEISQDWDRSANKMLIFNLCSSWKDELKPKNATGYKTKRDT